MGNTKSNENQDFWNSIVVHGEQRDPRFGNVTFYHHKSEPKKLYMYKNIWTDTSEESAAMSDFIQTRHAITHPNLAQVINYERARDDQFMTSFNKHGFAWEYFDNDLERELRRRKTDVYGGERSYSEPQVWYLLNSAINADLALKREGQYYHGDIQPATLLLDDANKVKMIDNRLVYPTKTLYERMLFDRNVHGALSPNLLDQLARKQVNPRYDPSREDSWALGMTGLCAASGKTLDDYYDWSVPRLRRDDIEMDLNSLEGNYSTSFINFLRNCLVDDETQRLPMEAHEDYLRNFQKDINLMELDFKKKRPKIIYQTEEKKKVTVQNEVVQNTFFNDIVTGGTDFFMDRPREETKVQVINSGGDFFDTPTIIDQPPVFNVITPTPGQPSYF